MSNPYSQPQESPQQDDVRRPPAELGLRRVPEPGWINSDIKAGPGIDIVARHPRRPAARGLEHRLHRQHPRAAGDSLSRPRARAPRAAARAEAGRGPAPRAARPRQGHRGLPRRTTATTFSSRTRTQPRIGAKFVTQMLWYGWSRTLFTHDFVEELLRQAGFRADRRLLLPPDQEPVPGDRGARQPRAREPLRRGGQVASEPESCSTETSSGSPAAT